MALQPITTLIGRGIPAAVFDIDLELWVAEETGPLHAQAYCSYRDMSIQTRPVTKALADLDDDAMCPDCYRPGAANVVNDVLQVVPRTSLHLNDLLRVAGMLVEALRIARDGAEVTGTQTRVDVQIAAGILLEYQRGDLPDRLRAEIDVALTKLTAADTVLRGRAAAKATRRLRRDRTQLHVVQWRCYPAQLDSRDAALLAAAELITAGGPFSYPAMAIMPMPYAGTGVRAIAFTDLGAAQPGDTEQTLRLALHLIAGGTTQPAKALQTARDAAA